MAGSVLDAVDEKHPCRRQQLQQLDALIGHDDLPSPPAFTVHGLEATGKTLILRSFLEAAEKSFSWVPCHETITARHLTERIAGTVAAAAGSPDTAYPRCESVSALAVLLHSLLKERDEKHFLVLDRMDCQREATPILFTSLAQLGELVPNLTVIFVISFPRHRSIAVLSAPHIHFPPYTKEECITILSQSVPRIRTLPSAAAAATRPSAWDDDPTPEMLEEEKWVWQKFLGTVWDTMAKGAAKNIVKFRALAVDMWLPFVQPIARGEYGTRNYSSLYLFHKDMFRGEALIVDSVLPVAERATTAATAAAAKTHDLPYYSKYLLCAAYLASYNPARLDVQYFVKATETKKKRRGGGGRKATGGGKTRKISARLLGAKSWPLERMLAIFHAITPEDVASSADLQAQVATLTSLRLLVKVSASDPLEGSTKWKVNVGWDYIRGVARSVKFDIEDHLSER